MRRRKLLPLAGLVALAVTTGLVGCGTVTLPTPTPTGTPTPTPEVTIPIVDPVDEPTTVGALPGSAFLRVSVTAEAGGEEVRLQLTFDRAAIQTAEPEAFEAVLDACPNALESQLDSYPTLTPTGVITSHLETTGDWPDGMTIAVIAGGQIASVGDGRNVAPIVDEPGMFGCTVSLVTGPGAAQFSSILLGDPAITDRVDLENAIALGLFGFEPDGGSAVTVRWRDCVIQLSSAAQRISAANGWTLPGQRNYGCLIGDDGSV